MAEKENFDSTHMKLVCHSRGATCNAAPLTEKVPILGYVYKTPVQGPVPDNDMLIRAPREKAVAGNCATSELSGRLPSLTPTHRILRRGSNDNIGMRSAGDDRSDSSVAKLRPRRQTVGDRAKYDVDDLVMLLDQMALQRLEARSNKSTGLISTEPDIIAADRQIETLPYKLRVPPPLSLNAKPNIYQLDNSSSVSGGYEQHTQIERKPRKRTKDSRPQNKDKLSIAVSTPPDLRQYIR
ncbi:hypothetical protein GGI05_003618 [Coemansia sp. RSA 2603]|nr:hypothetical protein GGI05_003618 [Coemansia sp. RSA 2603]